MKILVTVKRVSDPEAKLKIKPDGSWIQTEGVKFVVNPFDEIAVEEALRIKEKHTGEVVVVSIGDKPVTEQIRAALAMGADRGIFVNYPGQYDSFDIASILQKVVEQEKPDVIIMGKQAVDDDMGAAGYMLAELLGYPQAAFASKVEISDDKKKAKVTREIDGGLEVKEVELPAVITADLRLNTPRYASLPNIMKAKQKPIKEVTVDALGVTVKPHVIVKKLTEPPKRKGGVKVESVQELVNKLKNEAKVI
ncbi:MAG: electron transfer flavoprotein subunit beta/FixA family protein [bacterium]